MAFIHQEQVSTIVLQLDEQSRPCSTLEHHPSAISIPSSYQGTAPSKKRQHSLIYPSNSVSSNGTAPHQKRSPPSSVASRGTAPQQKRTILSHATASSGTAPQQKRISSQFITPFGTAPQQKRIIAPIPTPYPSSSGTAPQQKRHISTFVPSQVLPPPSDCLQWLQQLSNTSHQPAARPNLHFASSIFDATLRPATASPLRAVAWATLLKDYPDQVAVQQALGAIEHGVLLGYKGDYEHVGRNCKRNLPMTAEGKHHVDREIKDRLASGRIQELDASTLPVLSPLGTVPKPHSDKLRTIHHLSYPRNGISVNTGIQSSFVTIQYQDLNTVLDYVRHHRGALLYKVDLKEAFRMIQVAESQSRLLGFAWNGKMYGENALSFGGKSSPWLFNIFAELVHWMLDNILQRSESWQYSEVTHYLDDFFGACNVNSDGYWPVHLAYSLFSVLGLQGSLEKSFWCKQELEILGIVINSVQQTASISEQRKERVRNLCTDLLSRKSATLLEMQRVTGHLQFVTKIAPHGKAFMRRLYSMLGPLSTTYRCRLTRAAKEELKFWVQLLSSWDGVTLLQPQPLKAVHLWTDASKRCMGAHLGPAEAPSGVWFSEVAKRHRSKDIRFLEAKAVIDSLRHFQKKGLLEGYSKVAIHIDNENVRYGLTSGSSRDPLLQALLRAIFTFSLEFKLTLRPSRVPVRSGASALSGSVQPAILRGARATLSTEAPPGFAAIVDLPPFAATILWNGLSEATWKSAAGVIRKFEDYVSITFHQKPAFPAHKKWLICFICDSGKSYGAVKAYIQSLKSWHKTLGLSLDGFGPKLDRTLQGYKRYYGTDAPEAKFPITLPLLIAMLKVLPEVVPSLHLATYHAAFCLSFACFLRCGEITYNKFNPMFHLSVASVQLSSDGTYAVINIPASKTDKGRQGVKVVAPKTGGIYCTYTALLPLLNRPPNSPLFALYMYPNFTRSFFVTAMLQCISKCGISPANFSGHSFRQGAATWAATSGASDEVIKSMGRWDSDCFKRYIDKTAEERAAIAQQALFSTTNGPLIPKGPAWRE